ncbi:NADH:flavin oxidoreductase/NADH oxidase [Pseudomonas frederiksbergensis]|uniref:NADH:flavin oxidoreductase n=1 Tax=Pseudomonas frederiksbergensis TaxID=104087 RepID=A0A423KR85_9PSED|nr:NADH:flavin oxidoreductase/NADH oxidase [Pseudomonas frederiksbergensis]RON57887.1 NADH:flavin oxidoreductase [Pseudomonas frederiksbergensis]
MSALFQTFTLKSVTLRNRIVVTPMCQYSSIDGVANEWHYSHYASLARGGAGLVVVEATAVSPEGRITPGCAGLWNDEQAQALLPIVQSIKSAGAIAGIQLGHAGRKASANRPWEGDDHIAVDDAAGWETLSASAIALGGGLPKVPKAISTSEIERVKADFVAAAIRARDAGFEWLELHFAHGYLAMGFLSAHSNQRTDQYGGSFENRSRFIIETLGAIREVWPDNLPLVVRLGVIEYDGRDEETLLESIELAKTLKTMGVDLLDVSMGFSTPTPDVPWATPAFLAPVAQRFRDETGLPVTASWGIDTPELAEQAIEQGQLDLVSLGRAMLSNPHWPYHAARKLGVDKASWTLPAQYAHWLERYAVGA